MKTKAVFWAKNNDEKRLLFAMQLHPDANTVESWTFPEEITTPEFVQLMNEKWRDNHEIAFPEGFQHEKEELSVVRGLLPTELKPENPELISRLQAEWHFTVLSSKLYEAYKSELADISDKVNNMTKYSGALWDSLKNFWSKVQDNVRDKNLSRDHADQLRETTNVLFAQMKDARSALSNEFEEKSKMAYDALTKKLDDVETKIQEGILRFPQIFDMLRQTQGFYKEQKMTKDHGNDIWNRLDGLFKKIKQTKFGVAESTNATERLENRMEGLDGVIQKMQQGIDRDKKDLAYEQKRIDQSHGQLEAQIRQAKINMILERIKLKEVKLNDMLKTKGEVESKMENQKVRDAKRAEKSIPDAQLTNEENTLLATDTTIGNSTEEKLENHPVIDHHNHVENPTTEINNEPVSNVETAGAHPVVLASDKETVHQDNATDSEMLEHIEHAEPAIHQLVSDSLEPDSTAHI